MKRIRKFRNAARRIFLTVGVAFGFVMGSMTAVFAAAPGDASPKPTIGYFDGTPSDKIATPAKNGLATFLLVFGIIAFAGTLLGLYGISRETPKAGKATLVCGLIAIVCLAPAAFFLWIKDAGGSVANN